MNPPKKLKKMKERKMKRVKKEPCNSTSPMMIYLQRQHDEHDHDHDDGFYGNGIDDDNSKNKDSDIKMMMMMNRPLPLPPSSSSFPKSHHMMKVNNEPPATWSMGSLMAALPLSPSPICRPPSGTHSSLPSPEPNDDLPCNFSRVSTEFFTPRFQSPSVQSSLNKLSNSSNPPEEDQVFTKPQSPKCLSISTLYESAMDIHGSRDGVHSNRDAQQHYYYYYDNKAKGKDKEGASDEYSSESSTIVNDIEKGSVLCPVFPGVPEDMGYLQHRTRGGPNLHEGFAMAAPVIAGDEECPSRVGRPKPYQEFLDEVERHRHRAELDAWRKAKYSDLLKMLRKKEAAIDDWNLKQRDKAEIQLEKIERKLEKKRAKAIQKMHKRIADTKMEAEKRKARERRLILKEIAKLSHQGDTVTTRMLCF